MVAKNRKSPFVKEVLLALLILGNCLLPQLHLWVSDELTRITVFGYDYSHGYSSNQEFIWRLLCYVQILIYILISFYCTARRYKYALLALIYWVVYNTLVCLTPIAILEEIRSVLLWSAVFITLFLVNVKLVMAGEKSFTFKLPKDKLDVSIVVVLLLLPLLHRLSYNLPQGIREITILGHTVSSFGFQDLDAFFTYLFLKIYILVPLLFFFLATKRWWKYALLVPILLVVFQLKTAFNPHSEYLDTYEVVHALPLLISVLILLLFLSKAAYYQSKMVRLYQTTYDTLEVLVHKRFQNREEFLKTIKEKWQQLKTTPSDEQELLDLKQHLEQELRKK